MKKMIYFRLKWHIENKFILPCMLLQQEGGHNLLIAWLYCLMTVTRSRSGKSFERLRFLKTIPDI